MQQWILLVYCMFDKLQIILGLLSTEISNKITIEIYMYVLCVFIIESVPDLAKSKCQPLFHLPSDVH